MERMHSSVLRTSLFALVAASLVPAPCSAQQRLIENDSDTLASVMRLYKVDKAGAIDRLAREEAAADVYQALEAAPVAGYAGSWFDGKSLTLRAATSDPNGLAALRAAGAEPVLVRYSLKSLEALRAQLESAEGDAASFKKLYIDVRKNAVVYVTAAGAGKAAGTRLHARGIDAARVLIVEDDKAPRLSANIVGAEGTRNHTWVGQFGGALDNYPCSIGVSTVGGYVTAGHCGDIGNQMRTPAGVALGTVSASTYFASSTRPDRGWVDDAAGMTPTATINGYSDGTINVAAKWAGMNEVAVGSTVCRYGQTSFGPHCGTVVAKNLSVAFFGSDTITGITQVDGACTQDGDSGGPYVFATGQVQGINVGGDANSCPDDAGDTVYFQPIKPTLSAFAKTMLTSHGASAPTIVGFVCPDMTISGLGQYTCKISYYNSQGATSMSWSANTGHTSSTDKLTGTCSSGQTVTVNLSVANPYGSAPKNKSFSCPMGPIP